jgi:hypothetical protein
MPNEKLIRALNSVGKEQFVVNFDLFNDYYTGKLEKDQAVRKLVAAKVSNENGAKIRLTNAKTIFSNKWEKDALFIINDANISPEIKKLTTKLIIKLSR